MLYRIKRPHPILQQLFLEEKLVVRLVPLALDLHVARPALGQLDDRTAR